MRLNNTIHVERNIGDAVDVIAQKKNQLTERIVKANFAETIVNTTSSLKSLNGSDTLPKNFKDKGDGDGEPLKVDIRKKHTNLKDMQSDCTTYPSPRTLFLGMDY